LFLKYNSIILLNDKITSVKLKNWLLPIVLFCTILNIQGQEDSLRDKSYEYLFKKFKTYQNTSFDKATIYGTSFINKGKKENDLSRVSRGFFFLSLINKNEKAIQLIDSALFYNKNTSDKRLNVIYASKQGDLFYNIGAYKNALNSYIEAKKHIDEKTSAYNVYDIDYSIGLIKLRIGDFKEAKKAFKKNSDFLLKNNVNDKYLENYFINLNGLSFAHLYTHELDSAEFYNNLITKSAKKEAYLDYYNKSKVVQAIINYDKGNYQKGLDSIIKYSPLIENNQDSLDLALVYLYKGKGYQKLGNWENALPIFKKVDTIIQKKKIFNSQLRENYTILYDYYKKKGDAKNHIKYIERLVNFDSILYSNNAYLKSTLLKKYDVPKLIQEKEILIKQLENKGSKRLKILYALLAFVIVLILLLYYYYRKKQTYKRRFEELIKTKTLKNQEIKTDPVGLKKKLTVPESIIKGILNNIEIFEKEQQFLSNTITLNSLAKKIGTNSAYLSKVVNHYKNKNFSTYLSDLRINYVVEALKEQPKLREYTIKAIAFEVGFKNSESFTNAFYKQTKIYPSYFIKQLQKRKEIV